ncbi:MAG: IPT/TIG domain-containing protein [Chloroflexi bacterium]|nr:IPT/TIG domain-containing protein [Chloroflexota bacterium]
MNPRKRPQLLLILAALATLMCRCSLDSGAPVKLSFSDGSSVQCRRYTVYIATWNDPYGSTSDYDCEIPCPDGSTVKVEHLSRQQVGAEDETQDAEVLQSWQAQYCPVDPSTGGATRVPSTSSPAPTMTAMAARTATPSATAAPRPLLTGAVSACDLTQGFINFTLAQPPLDISSKVLNVRFNNIPARCSIPRVNPNVLTCNIPAGARPPVNISVTLDGVLVNSFNYSGAGCTSPKPNNPNQDKPPVNPTPTDWQG